MMRLQHYIEFCYLVTWAIAAWELARIWKDDRKLSLQMWGQLVVAVVFGPLMLAKQAVGFMRKEW